MLRGKRKVEVKVNVVALEEVPSVEGNLVVIDLDVIADALILYAEVVGLSEGRKVNAVNVF